MIIDIRHDGYYLDGRRLERGDELEVEIPFVGWRRGRFSKAFGHSLVSLPNGLQVRLDTDLVTARWPSDTPTFQCPHCSRVSFNRADVEHRYCGACHEFFR